MYDYEVTEAIAERDRKSLWFILECFDSQLSDIYWRTRDKTAEENAKDFIQAFQTILKWAENYPNTEKELRSNSKLLKIAQEFIISKGLQGEFNAIANEKM